MFVINSACCCWMLHIKKKKKISQTFEDEDVNQRKSTVEADWWCSWVIGGWDAHNQPHKGSSLHTRAGDGGLADNLDQWGNLTAWPCDHTTSTARRVYSHLTVKGQKHFLWWRRTIISAVHVGAWDVTQRICRERFIFSYYLFIHSFIYWHFQTVNKTGCLCTFFMFSRNNK